MARWTHWESEAERIFEEDTRDKKRIAHSAKKRPHGGAMRTPIDLLRGKEKRQYSKAGGLKIMFHIPDTYPELLALSEEQQRSILKYLFEDVFTTDPTAKKTLCKQWGMQAGALHKKAQGLGVIDKQEPKPKKEKKSKTSVVEQAEPEAEVKTANDVFIINSEIIEAIRRLEARQANIEMLLQQTIEILSVRASITPYAIQKSEADTAAEFMAKVLSNINNK